jgi:hypothetical protein
VGPKESPPEQRLRRRVSFVELHAAPTREIHPIVGGARFGNRESGELYSGWK